MWPLWAVVGCECCHSSTLPPNTPYVVRGVICLPLTLPNLHQTSDWWLFRWQFNWQGQLLNVVETRLDRVKGTRNVDVQVCIIL